MQNNEQTPLEQFCLGSIFVTTYRPTVFFEVIGNSGDKSAEEQAVSGRKHLKVPETAKKAF